VIKVDIKTSMKKCNMSEQDDLEMVLRSLVEQRITTTTPTTIAELLWPGRKVRKTNGEMASVPSARAHRLLSGCKVVREHLPGEWLILEDRLEVLAIDQTHQRLYKIGLRTKSKLVMAVIEQIFFAVDYTAAIRTIRSASSPVELDALSQGLRGAEWLHPMGIPSAVEARQVELIEQRKNGMATTVIPQPIDVLIDGRRYRVTYYSNGDLSDVFVCDVRTRERGQPRGAWALDGMRRLPKSGPKARAVLAAVAQG